MEIQKSVESNRILQEQKSVIHNVLITTKGLKYNEYSGFFDNVITLDELFT